jgi:hypothetical protein
MCGAPVDQVDARKSGGWVTDDKDQHRLVKVGLGVVVAERSDPHGGKQLVRLELNLAEPGGTPQDWLGVRWASDPRLCPAGCPRPASMAGNVPG